MGSPPPAGSKKVVFMFRSVSNIVIAPASTGSLRRRRNAVMNTDQTNRGRRSKVTPGVRMFMTVVMKFIEAKIEEAPAKCRENIARSTDPPAWAILLDRGGYIVQPVPAPLSTPAEARSRMKEGGTSQNLMFFIRGKAMSGAPIISGISQFPKPPIIIGITMKNIITRAWAVTTTL